MRKSGICPKCTSNQVLHVGAVADTAGKYGGIHSHMYLAIMVTGQGLLGGDKESTVGRVSAVMCRQCGFTELYVIDPENVRPDGKYITDLSGPKSTTPHR